MSISNAIIYQAVSALKKSYNFLYDPELSDEQRGEVKELIHICKRIASFDSDLKDRFGEDAEEAGRVFGQIMMRDYFDGEVPPYQDLDEDEDANFRRGMMDEIAEELAKAEIGKRQ